MTKVPVSGMYVSLFMWNYFREICSSFLIAEQLLITFVPMAEIRKYDLEELEYHYRNLTTKGDAEAAQRMRSIIANIRYDLANDVEVYMEYKSGMDAPLVMRILRTEKDLDRWVEQRFIRLAEFSSR